MRSGFTIIEIIVAMGLLAILMVAGFVALNPAGQLAASRNTQRSLHLQALISAIRQNMADTSGGAFTCSAGTLPSTPKKMAVGAGNYDIAPCLLPIYILTMPYDPRAAGAHYTSNSDYDTGYTIVYSASTTQITLSAPSAELGQSISITR